MPYFEHDNLAVYPRAVGVAAAAHRLVAELSPGNGHIADQLRRASLSIALNLAEGASEWRPGDKARFYRYATRSAAECCAILDVLRAIGELDGERWRKGRNELVEVAAMCGGLSRSAIEAARSGGVKDKGKDKDKGGRGRG